MVRREHALCLNVGILIEVRKHPGTKFDLFSFHLFLFVVVFRTEFSLNIKTFIDIHIEHRIHVMALFISFLFSGQSAELIDF